MEYKETLWLGVSPLKWGTERCNKLARYLGGFEVSYPNETGGMMTYDYYRGIFERFEVIATDQVDIDASYENFFCSDNWGKRIVVYDGNEWSDLKPGFSKKKEETSNGYVRNKIKDDE